MKGGLRYFLGISNMKDAKIFLILASLAFLWYAQLLISLNHDNDRYYITNFDVLVSASAAAQKDIVKTFTEQDGNQLILNRYSDAVLIAVISNGRVENVECTIESNGEKMHKRLKKIDENHFFGRLTGEDPYVSVECEVNGYSLIAYSIFDEDLTKYPENLGGYVFTTPIKSLQKTYNYLGGGSGGMPAIPYI